MMGISIGDARAADIPFWSVERGWVKHTLMMDTGENNHLSEMRTSLALCRLREQRDPQAATLERLRARARHATDLGRYPGPNRLTRSAALWPILSPTLGPSALASAAASFAGLAGAASAVPELEAPPQAAARTKAAVARAKPGRDVVFISPV